MSAQPIAPEPDPSPEAVAVNLLTALRIERGHPEPEELAALTVVLTRLTAAPVAPPPPAPHSRWADRRHALGLPPAPGPGGWRASALPR
ncbi:acyl-CoA carboxylase subunit epsilon [Paenibacillus sp. TRM 82003]|uniref:acyl-CoA carboxylase subunit epsilon n=1 Tax=Kineococcus sp. TRM81007 TaxID=2925831 RepID=UPI001F58C559|nr:acyl-CoA carboxylase subunit epsilon [Kineococcus sp. TRM81007]MCI2238221.1 acyl-CoA carboxylase subunit epsilon [Kineococcus sp. TRM81007]MCI3924107.1 acyl-CoA carboxylase subunit epsilon [Paenibacillus sp. TRM 82003]